MASVIVARPVRYSQKGIVRRGVGWLSSEEAGGFPKRGLEG